MPRFSLHGPTLRLELEVPLPLVRMRLRVAPEALWITHATQALTEVAGRSPRLALGGEVELTLPLGERLGFHLYFRQSQTLQLDDPSGIRDVDRYFLAEASYQMF